MTWSPSVPYNDLPPLPPVAILETHRVLKHTIEARAALSAVNTSIASLSNPYVLINSISLLEAQASSEIENIVTTTDDLFSFAENMGESGDPEVREALRYRLALFDGIEHLTTRPITTDLARAMCTRIKGHDMEIRSLPGTFIGNPATGEAVYTPPVGFVVIQEKLDRWEEFVNNPGTLDPLVAMAVSHYQFEAIHPFADGNGRTGRILNVLSLVGARLLDAPVLYLSKYIIDNKNEYYSRLLDVTAKGAWEDWLVFMIRGIEVTSKATLQKVDALREAVTQYTAQFRMLLPGGSKAELVNLLFEKPYCRIGDVMSTCSVSRPTATLWLSLLAAEGILEKQTRGRERLYINSRFMEILRG